MAGDQQSLGGRRRPRKHKHGQGGRSQHEANVHARHVDDRILRGISYAHMDSTSEVVNSEHMNPPPRASCCRASHTVAASSINEAMYAMIRHFDAELRSLTLTSVLVPFPHKA